MPNLASRRCADRRPHSVIHVDTPKLADYRRQIDAALEYSGGTHLFEDIEHLVSTGDLQAWFAPNSIIVTELIEYPRKRVCSVFLAGGDARELEAITPLVEQWAITKGCNMAQLIGRRGWSRTYLTRIGWRQSQLEIMQKDFTGR